MTTTPKEICILPTDEQWQALYWLDRSDPVGYAQARFNDLLNNYVQQYNLAVVPAPVDEVAKAYAEAPLKDQREVAQILGVKTT